MKMKFTAALALIVWLGVVAWLATLVIVKPAVLRMGNDSEETSVMTELRASVERNRQSMQKIATLRQISNIDTSTPLIAPSVAPGVPGSGMHGASGVAYVDHNVSMILTTNGRRTAIINGEPVRSGSRLSDGTRVRRISNTTVELQNSEGESTVLKVLSPFQQQSGGGR